MLIPVTGPDLGRRLAQLVIGLVLFGFGIALTLRSGLGIPPWEVLHQGLAFQFGLTVGRWAIIVSFLVLLLWIPLREPIGIGTVLNGVLIGLTIDATMAVIGPAASPASAWGMLIAGIAVNGLASGMYIGARLGPGARDGLMTAIARRGPSVRLARTAIEVTVLAIGWSMGGTFGVGTVLFALSIGPQVQFWLPRFDTIVKRARIPR